MSVVTEDDTTCHSQPEPRPSTRKVVGGGSPVWRARRLARPRCHAARLLRSHDRLRTPLACRPASKIRPWRRLRFGAAGLGRPGARAFGHGISTRPSGRPARVSPDKKHRRPKDKSGSVPEDGHGPPAVPRFADLRCASGGCFRDVSTAPPRLGRGGLYGNSVDSPWSPCCFLNKSTVYCRRPNRGDPCQQAVQGGLAPALACRLNRSSEVTDQKNDRVRRFRHSELPTYAGIPVKLSIIF